MGRTKLGLIGGVLVIGFVVSQAGWGWFIFDDSDPFSIVAGLLFAAWLLVPFVPIALAIADGTPSPVAIAVAFAVAVAGSLLVPRLTDSAIADDPSSTASLLHIYDPLPTVLTVGLIFGCDYLVRRFGARDSAR